MSKIWIGYDTKHEKFVIHQEQQVHRDLIQKILRKHVFDKHWGFDGRYFRFEPYAFNIHKIFPRLSKIRGAKLRFTDGAKQRIKWVNDSSKARMDLCYATSIDTPEYNDMEVKGLNFPLRDFQKLPIYARMKYPDWYSKMILGDEMGCGKTIEIISMIAHFDLTPALIVVPKTLIVNWTEECSKWMSSNPRIKTFKNGKDSQTNGYDIFIVSYTMLSYMSNKVYKALFRRRLKFCAADEAHYLKNTTSKRTTACREIFKKCENVVLATGTPIKNNPIDLFSLYQIQGKQNIFGDKTSYEDYFCNAHVNSLGYRDTRGSDNIPELNMIFRSSGTIRRKKEQVAKELPEINEMTVYVDISNRAEYERAEEEFIEWVKDSTIEMLLADGLSMETAEEEAIQKVAKALAAEHLVKSNALRQLVAKGKMEFLKEWVNSAYEEGNPQCIFLNYTSVQEYVKEEFADRDILHIFGSDSVKFRDECKKRFQDPNGPEVIFLAIAIAGVGLTLTRSSRVTMFELPWTPADVDQCIARVHRIGQKANQVDAYYILGKDTIDQYMYETVITKRNIANQVIDGKEPDGTELNNTTTVTQMVTDIIKGKIKNHFWEK